MATRLGVRLPWMKTHVGMPDNERADGRANSTLGGGTGGAG